MNPKYPLLLSEDKMGLDKYVFSKQELGKKLRDIRQMSRLVQQQIADYLGVDRSTYAYYETAKTLPDIFTLVKLSCFYQVDIYYFLIKND